MQEIAVPTAQRCQLIDITREVEKAVLNEGVREGLCHVFVPHTTAGVTINENADPDVSRDVQVALTGLVPERGDYRHAEGNSDSHVKSTVVNCSATVPVSGGRLMLGTWQAIYFCEFDGPRRRRCLVTAIGT